MKITYNQLPKSVQKHVHDPSAIEWIKQFSDTTITIKYKWSAKYQRFRFNPKSSKDNYWTLEQEWYG